jgi:NADH-quinone oxidoreductase subunit N
MDLSVLREFTQTNVWGVLQPEVMLVLLALLVMLMDLFVKRDASRLVGGMMLIGLGTLLIVNVGHWVLMSKTIAFTAFSGMVTTDYLGQFMRVFFLLSAFLVTLLSFVYFKKQLMKRLSSAEFYFLLLTVTAAMMLVVESRNFVLFFVALEMLTIGFYVLVGYCRESVFSLEAGLKYLILGALSSAFLLFGIVLLYGLASNPMMPGGGKDGFSYGVLYSFVATNANNPLVLVAVTLVVVGVAFKIGAVPFQIWIPDVYQGAPTPVTAYLAVASKAAGFAVLMNLISGPFAGVKGFLYLLLSVMAVMTIVFANLAALSQRNVKRLMGLSGISHAGYLMVGLVAGILVNWAMGAVLFYLFTYLLGSFLVFAVMTHMASADDEAQKLEDYLGLAKRDGFMAWILTIGLGSLAGVPPMAGFIGKLLIFIAAYQAGLYGLLAVSIFGVIVSVYYYFGWVREALFRSWYESKKTPMNTDAGTISEICETGVLEYKSPTCVYKLIFGAIAAVTVLLGLYQGWFTGMFFL